MIKPLLINFKYMSEKFHGEENGVEPSSTEKEKLIEKLSSTPIEDIIKLYPELAEKVEALRLVNETDHLAGPISLLRTKKHPDVAYAIWSRANSFRGEKHEVSLEIPEQNLNKKDRKLKFNLIASCCHPEIANAGKPPFGYLPSYSEMYPGADEYKDEESAERNRGRIGVTSNTIRLQDYHELEDRWRKKYNEEWIKPKQKEFSEVIEALCKQNGIKEVIMETPSGDKTKYYDYLKDIKIIETEKDYAIES